MDKAEYLNKVMKESCGTALVPVRRLNAYFELNFLVSCYEGGLFNKDSIASEIYYKLTSEYKTWHKHCWALCA